MLDCVRLARLRDQCPDAWDDLCRALRPHLRAIAAAKLPAEIRRRVDPSDIVQETLTEASLSFAAFEGDTLAELRVWLVAILQHNLTDALRAHLRAKCRTIRSEQRPDRSHAAALNVLENCAADLTSPSMCAAKNETFVALADSLRRLPSRQHQAVRLRHLEGWAIADIALALGCTAEAAAATIARGLRALREQDRRVVLAD